MAKNTKQIALIQHRRGDLSELPTQLNEGEFGLSLNTNQLFIGNPSNEYLSKRIDENIFPYGNIEVLTEFTDNMQKIKYTYKSNTDVIARFPISLIGDTPYPSLAADSSIKINGTEILFKTLSDLPTIVDTINSKTDENGDKLSVKAYIYNDAYFGLISNDQELTIENGRQPSYQEETNLSILGLTSEKSYSKIAEPLPFRTLQQSLDDNLSIKAFGVKGDGVTDDSNTIYNSIISIYKCGEHCSYYRSIQFPAGEYIISSSPIPLPSGTHLFGNGIGRTIVKTVDYNGYILSSMDDNTITLGTPSFSKNSNEIKYVTIEDMTFDVSSTNSSVLMTLGSSSNVLFKNVEFIGSVSQTSFANIENGTNINSSSNIMFENCIFKNGAHGIVANHNCHNLIIKNCIFENISKEAIIIGNLQEEVINTIIDGNTFINCSFSNSSDNIILLGDNAYQSKTINNTFDKELVDTNYKTAYPYNSSNPTNYSDIWNKNTDTKKLYKYSYSQPSWEYIDYLLNPNGEYIIKSEYKNTNPTSDLDANPLTNGLVIQQGDSYNQNELTLHASLNYGDININSGGYSNINIGKNDESSFYNDWNNETYYNNGDYVQYTDNESTKIYQCIISNINTSVDNETYWKKIETYKPYIIFHKDVDLNDSSITNNGNNKNIQLNVKDDGIVLINDNYQDDLDRYSKNISSVLNAVPTVQYVNKATNSTVNKIINYNSFLNSKSNEIELVYFDPEIYGDVINFDTLSINVRRPFYPIKPLINSAKTWVQNNRYYIGDVIYDEEDKSYFICTQEHFAVEEKMNYVHWNLLLKSGEDITGKTIDNIPDIKYVSIYATNKVDNPMRLLFERNEVNVSLRDIKSNYYPKWKLGKQYNVNDIVELNDRYYKCRKAHTSTSENEIHVIELWNCPREEGFNYIYNFDREMIPLDKDTKAIIDTIDESNTHYDEKSDTGYLVDPITVYNFSGYYLYVEFLDENMNLVPIMKFPDILTRIWSKNTEYYTGEIINHNDTSYEVITDFVSTDIFDTTYLINVEHEDEIHVQANPSGFLNIKLKYVRGDNYEN